MKSFYFIPFFVFLSSLCFAQSYTNIESVEYDASQNRFLVSNGSSIIQRASDGTLSYFGSGSANYGMEVMNGTLFAISSSSIKGFDLGTEDEVMNLSIPGAGFLNGLTNDGNGKLWATDFGNNTIYEIDVTDLDNPSSSIVVSNTGSTPNGIVYDGTNDRLIFVSWGGSAAIKAVSLSDYAVSTITTTPYGNIDGIDEDNDGNYYIAYWSPSGVSKYPADFSSPTTISVPGISSPADICYAKEIDSLAIPSGGNNVLFVGFDTSTPVGEVIDEKYQFSMGPNPMATETTIQFHLEAQERVNLGIYSLDGKLVKSLSDGEMIQGWHKVMLMGIELSAGTYIINMETKKGLITEKLVVR
jgi:hypothetical protein